MKYVKYSKYIPDPFEDLSAEDLLQMLGDFLLDSGFYNQYRNIYEMVPERTMDQLHQALLEALHDQGKIPDDLLQQMLQNWEDYQNSELAEKINKLLERLSEEGYVSVGQPNPGQGEIMNRKGNLSAGQQEGKAKFEVTDKALDFLGFKTLRDLLGSLGKSSFGRHDTRELSTGVES